MRPSLSDSSPHTEVALRHLLDIYEQEKDWQKAVEIARKLESRSSESMSARIAQYYCEMAENEERHGEVAKALRLVKRALAEAK